jgi:hypothetical protein
MSHTAAQTRTSGARPHEGEGCVAKMIEEQTAKLPSILGSLVLKAMGDEKDSQFVGQWAPTFLILGLYNKLVKLHGSE